MANIWWFYITKKSDDKLLITVSLLVVLVASVGVMMFINNLPAGLTVLINDKEDLSDNIDNKLITKNVEEQIVTKEVYGEETTMYLQSDAETTYKHMNEFNYLLDQYVIRNANLVVEFKNIGNIEEFETKTLKVTMNDLPCDNVVISNLRKTFRCPLANTDQIGKRDHKTEVDFTTNISGEVAIEDKIIFGLVKLEWFSFFVYLFL